MSPTRARESITARRIRAAAAELFSSHGYHATSMREIAAAVGIRPASVYAHFAGKEDILFAIAAGTMEEMLEGARQACAAAEDPASELRALVEFHVRYSAENRVTAKVADDELRGLGKQRREQVVAIRDRYEALFRSVLERGRDDCGWPIADVAVTAFALATMASGVGLWYRRGRRLSAEQVAAIYAELALRAAGATC